MTPEHEHFSTWDAAYVLGGLSAVDRALYEAHLTGCAQCRTAIAEIAPTLGLLARVDAERALKLTEPESLGDTRLVIAKRERLIAAGAAQTQQRRRQRWLSGVAAAAALAIAALIIPRVLPLDSSSTVQFEVVANAPLSATAEIVEATWGTAIEMTCAYDAKKYSSASSDEVIYTLVVTATDGTESELSTWRASPGETARVSAVTALTADEISRVEIRAEETGAVLMRTEGWDLGNG